MAALGGVAITDLFLLSEAQMRRIKPFFPLSHGVPRVDDRRVISGIVFVIRNGLRSVAVLSLLKSIFGVGICLPVRIATGDYLFAD